MLVLKTIVLAATLLFPTYAHGAVERENMFDAGSRALCASLRYVDEQQLCRLEEITGRREAARYSQMGVSQESASYCISESSNGKLFSWYFFSECLLREVVDKNRRSHGQH